MSFYEYAATQQINYRFECPEQELKLWFDPVQLQKVIFNLISNAFKYTPKGGKINVSISSTNTQAHISIKDNGSGIPQEAVNKIFERFYQLENGANKFTLGTGIGLALSKGIIDLHHGNIHVKSEPEQGSEFIIDLLKGNSHFSPEDIAHTRLTTDDSTAAKAAETINTQLGNAGSKFKAVNTRDKNFTVTKLKKRMEQVAEHIAGYLQDLGARGGLYIEAVAREDYERDIIDEDLTDQRLYRHRGELYRRGLQPHFKELGGGVWLSRQADMPLFELECVGG